MQHIRIRTEQVRGAAQRFDYASTQLTETAATLRRAIHSLDTGAWDSHSRWRIESELGRVSPRCQELAEELNRLGCLLKKVADSFEQQDAQASTAVFNLPWDLDLATPLMLGVALGGAGKDAFVPATDVTGGNLKNASKAAEIYQLLDDVQDIRGSFEAVGVVTFGGTYLGQVVIKGGHALKTDLGLSPYLTHIKAANLPKHMAKTAFKDGFSKGNILLEGVSELGENWEEYKGGTSRIATGIIVDTALGVGCSAAGAWAGAAAGAALGSALGPVGTVIGGKIGGVLGTRAGSWAAEKLENVKVDDQELDQWLVDGFINGVKAGTQHLDRALDDLAGEVSRLF
ncbi:MAG: WXG100 family type VII secretion target [Anaerolineae bacterium]|nr:WXG100 family type VII secretion target [Anaerolineae bacterium]